MKFSGIRTRADAAIHIGVETYSVGSAKFSLSYCGNDERIPPGGIFYKK